MKTNFVNNSFKHKLRATYTLLMFIVLILICTFLYYQVNNIIKPLISHIGLQVVDGEAQYLGERFKNQETILALLASTETFKNGDLSSIEQEMDNQITRNKDLWLSMKYKGINGDQYVINPENIKPSLSFEDELLAGDQMTLTSKLLANQDNDYTTYIGTKVLDDRGNLKGLIVINVRIKQLMGSFLEAKIRQFTEVWFLDASGKVIINPNQEEKSTIEIENFGELISASPSGELNFTTQKGEFNYLIYSKVPNIEGLYLAIGIDHRESSEAMRFLLMMIVGGALFACLFIFIAANKMTKVMTQPLTRMVEIIQDSDGTNLIEIPSDLKASKDEIGILAKTIGEMSSNIRNNVQALNNEIHVRQRAEAELIQLNVELECRVKERTHALTEVTNHLANSENRFRIAMEASHIGLYDSDCNHVVVVNGIFLKLINAPDYKENLIKESDWIQLNGKLEDFVYSQDLNSMGLFNVNNMPMVGEDFYTEVRLKADPNVWFSFIGQVIKKDEDGKIRRFIGVLQNITERKRTEEELKRAMEAAEEASQAKSQFLANMSHEIRTPMNAIMGLAHLLAQSDLKESQQNYVAKIEGASKTLLRIINDVLDFSKIEAGKLEIENIKFNLDKVLENVANLYSISAAEKGIDLNFDTGEGVPDVLIGDPLRLEQVLSNLITNAIKFTNRGEVNVSVKVLGENNDEVKLSFTVSDTGIGITKEHIGRLFRAFTQADGSMTRKYGGTGLGLTISKQLVELMNGEISVESVYGEGTSFHFIVHFHKALDLKKPSCSNYPDLQGKKALIIDHNKTSLTILERMLRSFSLEVTALNDPFEALERLHRECFDLLVIDFNLPELPGIEFYKRIIANPDIALPKTIFVSAIGRETHYHQVKQLGVRNFLVKPINQSLMFDAIMNALNGTALHQGEVIHDEANSRKHRGELADKRVLVVEDNDINQLVAKDMLEQAGMLVSIANNGEEAIKYVHANKFAAVLMDVQMPVMDGYKATEILRKTYSSSELPIIAMTANALRGDRERSIAAGMNDYISKPIDPNRLFDTLEKWLLGKGVKCLEAVDDEVIEVLDIEKTLLRLNQKREFYEDLLRRYAANYSNWVNDFSNLRQKQTDEEAQRLIHSLKGVTGTIGAMKLNRCLVQFEEDWAFMDEQVLEEKLAELAKLNDELLEAIKQCISLKGTKKEPLSSKFDVNTAFDELLYALEKARPKEIKESMIYLVDNFQGMPYYPQIEELKKLTDRYRYKEAKAMAEKVRELVKEQSHG
ncbi:signal transduction histidine kinase [Desulfosporosinus orientis DSM 765]|uniref:Circadian input-output histidine kinase CikA n=1 Tax=Desulfosporosinus orientis (strain ATCC 19365 / DSM 765 / NCIMB 8382 / VKM B-1628 / Singapore I) TaxID=768706 RepID=G7W9K4_DESOD|nr:response regulator [Desulfosporosinus orientis]AET69921.1 signal transduction histidine kinase [Desulfosporosinus orientis DSM 765]